MWARCASTTSDEEISLRRIAVANSCAGTKIGSSIAYTSHIEILLVSPKNLPFPPSHMMSPTRARCMHTRRMGELPRTRLRRSSQNNPSTHSAEYRSNSQGATYGCAPRRPRRGADPETERRIRYNAFPNVPTESSGWVLGEDRTPNANTNGPIRVLLADDQTLFREGLAGILASYRGMEIIAEVPNDAEALRLVGELSPDVVIMQVQMPFERAKETLQAMRSFPDPPKVVIVTMFESPHYVRGLTR